MAAEPSTRRARRWALALTAAALVAGVLLHSGVAPGTVAEQRARLPPAASCADDPVAGYWRSHQFLEKDRQWTEFTLEIHRVGNGNLLTGKITNHTWRGGADREQPGLCGPEQPYRLRFSMTAKGEVDGENIRFEGTSWKLDEVVCGGRPVGLRYFLDRFTGKIDAKLQEFQSVNNDGGRMVDYPTVFRRIRCLSDGPTAEVKVKKPAFFPKSASGCGCALAVGG
jgi:hypothetical protein